MYENCIHNPRLFDNGFLRKTDTSRRKLKVGEEKCIMRRFKLILEI
jgi:hypothetical protein